jgi:hypothetical protein
MRSLVCLYLVKFMATLLEIVGSNSSSPTDQSTRPATNKDKELTKPLDSWLVNNRLLFNSYCTVIYLILSKINLYCIVLFIIIIVYR